MKPCNGSCHRDSVVCVRCESHGPQACAPCRKAGARKLITSAPSPDPWTETTDNGDGTVRIVGWHEATGRFEAVLDESDLLAALAVVQGRDRAGVKAVRQAGHSAWVRHVQDQPGWQR